MFEFYASTSPAAKAHLDSQLSMFKDLSHQLFDSAQRLNELNIQLAQTLMEETTTNINQILCAKDANEVMSVVSSQAQPAADKLRAYQQHLADIAAGTQVNLAKTAETHVPKTARTAQELASEVARKASEETEKATQRQKAAAEKATAPIGKFSDAEKRSGQQPTATH